MKCPIDNTELVMSERQNIEIDYCPECRGIWLDRGELDKLIDRSDAVSTKSSEQHPPKSSDNYGKKRKREGFLGELFDF